MAVEEENKLKIQDIKLVISDAKIEELKKIPCTKAIIGQERAIEALKMGSNIQGEGYNIFVIGESGTGRRTAIASLLSSYSPPPNLLQDMAYAYNFNTPSEPILLYFPKGKGVEFKCKMQKAIKSINKKIKLMIKNGQLFYKISQKKEEATLAEVDNIAKFQEMLKKKGFKALEKKDGGAPEICPIFEGRPISFLKLKKLVIKGKITEEEFKRTKKDYSVLLESLHDFLIHLNQVEKKIEKDIKQLKNTLLKPIIQTEIKKLFVLVNSYSSLCTTEKQRQDMQKLKTFLKQARKDLYKKINVLSHPFKNKGAYHQFMDRYDINLIYKNTKDKKYVIDEPITQASDLFGTIALDSEVDKNPINGHLKIKEGAIHKALNGYIILRLDSLLKEEDAWEYLKNILLSKKIKIPNQMRSSHSSCILNPEAIESVPKVVVIGDEELYSIISQEEPDFYKLFKVCAQFDSTMLRNEENMAQFVALVSSLQKKQNLLPLELSSYKRLIIFSSEIAESHQMLSTQFTKIADCLLEADYIARKNGKDAITEKEISESIEKRHYIHSLMEEKYLNLLKMKDLIIEVKNKTVARVNGLAVEEGSYYSFGVPIAITAQVSCGMGGVINIEKEVGLSGEIFDKAHLIITSLLRRKFLKRYPLCISASICSEQSYSFIDGDSASCAHFLSLVSAIGELPMRQDIAVTGSLNQLGEVQAVGGVSEKIKGFFQACKILGFTGKGGVVIPESNRTNLFLDDEILDAMEKGYFNIWTIKNIDEAIELLSEVKCTEYSPIIENALEEFAKTIMSMHL